MSILGYSIEQMARAAFGRTPQWAQTARLGVERATHAARQAAEQAYAAGLNLGRQAGDLAQRGWTAGVGLGAATVGAAAATGAAVARGTAVVAAEGYSKVKARFADKQPSLQALTRCESVEAESAQARQERILRRKALIAHGKQQPGTRQAAEQLERDMQSVELARLSAHVYTHYDPDTKNPSPLPKPWKVASDEDLVKMGLIPGTVKDARAAVYTLPAGFPFEPKMVVAFRGTTGETEDILVDHDHAMGLETRQYGRSMQLGAMLGRFKPPPMVTGHSLGGGKAQAAVVAAEGAVRGQMFNAAGVHPDALGRPAGELSRFAALCNQQRTSGGLSVGGGDPLTGSQMSMAAQKLAFGVASAANAVGRRTRDGLEALGFDPSAVVPAEESALMAGLGARISTITKEAAAENFQKFGWYLPPTIGQEKTQSVVSKNADGTDSGLVAQHSIVNMVNGYESRKTADVERLLQGLGVRASVGHYLGPR